MITLSEPAKTNLLNKFAQSTNIEMGIGATLDINCNTLVSFSDDDFTGANYYSSTDGRQPFKLLFPIDSVVKPFRPEKCGIKYAIIGDVATGTYNNPRGATYKTNSGVTYRTYCPSKNLYYKYYVTQKNTNADITIRYFDNATGITNSNKAVPANKIVVKFERAHSVPTSWSIFINGTDVTTGMTKTVDANGIVTIYYNGTTWTTTASSINYNAQVTVNTIRVTATNPGSNQYVGIIEVAPHWVKDLTDRIVSFGIQKEASDTSDDILPVGLATANSLDMELNSYGNANILFRTYKPEESIAINNSYIYMIKKAEIQPYYKVYDAAGDLSDSKGTYYKIPQGSFYLDSWKIGENGELSMFALDAAKFLQETICPDIICDDHSSMAVIRRILDSIGFTNYNINTADGAQEKSIIGLRWWWSDGTKTVWAAIQEICKDIQMSALFDENNVLQFYSRDYIFTKKPTLGTDWVLRDTASGNILPNLISLDAETVPSSNNVKVFYNSVFVAGYEQSNKSLVEVDKTSFAAAYLISDLPSTTGAGGYVELDIISIKPEEVKTTETLQSFSGYLLINSEVIEYDAIQYEYAPIGGGARVQVDITGPSDLAKYRGEAIVLGSLVGFIPTKKYRIKKRGAFGTDIPTTHPKTPDGPPAGWTSYKDGVVTSGIVTGSISGAGVGTAVNDYNESYYARRTGERSSI